jgi:HK97 family phage portal protein
MFDWIRKLVNLVPQPRTPTYQGLFYGRNAGMVVNPATILTHATVWACARIISETIATLGWHVMNNKPDGTRERSLNDKLIRLLNSQANPEMTAFTWRETALLHAMIYGNHYSEIVRDGGGRPIELWPLDPVRTPVTIKHNDAGELRFCVSAEDYEREIPAANMLHVHGLGSDGHYGLSVLQLARRSIGSGLAMGEFGANFFANGAHVGIALKHPGKLSEQAKDYLKKSFNAAYSGPTNVAKTVVLEEGMELERLSMTMLDAQFLESRAFDVLEICRWFRVPPHKVADLQRATFSNIEHQAIEFVTDTILPWCRRLEQEVDIKLIGYGLQVTKSTRLNIDTLLRGDVMSRFNAYEKGRLGGWLSANDVRRLENMGPIENGDIYLQPMNYMEAGEERPTTGAAAAPAEDPEDTTDATTSATAPEDSAVTVLRTPPWRRAHG